MAQTLFPLKSPNRPELVVGIVTTIGTDLDCFLKELSDALQRFNYKSTTIHLIDQLKGVRNFLHFFNHGRRDKALNSKMDAGNAYRISLQRPDALAILGISAISNHRATEVENPIQAGNIAYLIRSLKTPDEIKLLRAIYGKNCIIFSVFASESNRIESLSHQIAVSYNSQKPDLYKSKAYELVNRDESESDSHGQNVREAFPLGDFFFDLTYPQSLKTSLQRAIDLIFGHPLCTPNKEEHAMNFASAASLRSAATSRQVGAAVTNSDGDILSIGCNEVPKSGGGFYWEGDSIDARDHLRPIDANKEVIANIFGDLIEQFQTERILDSKFLGKTATEITVFIQKQMAKKGKKLSLFNITEFGRQVHAEMSCIIEAARRGISLDNCSLLTTTFPCHNCAKHIIASGIREVIYIEPYPKSNAYLLHSDAISLELDPGASTHKVNFRHYVGVAPRLYNELFQHVGKLRQTKDQVSQYHRTSAFPSIMEPNKLYLILEQDLIHKLGKYTT